MNQSINASNFDLKPPALVHVYHAVDNSLSGLASGCIAHGHSALHYSLDCGIAPLALGLELR